MSLADEVLAVRFRTGPRCTVSVVAERLDETDRADLERLIDDPDVLGSAIAAALTRRGLTVKPQTVNRHRRRLCDCR